MDVGASFIPDAEATKLMQPRIRSFHHPAMDTQSAPVFGVPLSKDGFNTACFQGLAVRLRMISPIALHAIRTSTRPPALARDGGNRIHQGKQLGYIVAIRAGNRRGERNTVRIGKDVMLRPVFAAIRGVRTSLRPPKTARTLELSTTARDQSSRSALRRRFRNRCRTSCQTPASCQSRSRRQQVIPHPQSISLGKSSQGMPLFKTNRIPVSTLRLGTGGRPPWGCGLGAGRHGSMTAQSSSVSIGLAMSLSSITNRNRCRTLPHRINRQLRNRFC